MPQPGLQYQRRARVGVGFQLLERLRQRVEGRVAEAAVHEDGFEAGFVKRQDGLAFGEEVPWEGEGGVVFGDGKRGGTGGGGWVEGFVVLDVWGGEVER